MHSKSKAALNLQDKQDASLLLLAIRYRDTLPLLEITNKDKKYESFVGFVKAMLLGYGSTHSAHGSGFFGDTYHREADLNLSSITPLKPMLFNHMVEVHNMSKGEQKKSWLFLYKYFPISSSEATQDILKCFLGNVKSDIHYPTIAGRKHPVLTLAKRKTAHIQTALGHLGVFPTRDSQLWITANSGDFKKLFATLFKKMDPHVTLDDYIKNLTYQPSSDNSVEIQATILKDLKQSQEEKYDAQQVFYLSLLEKLISTLKMPDKKHTPTESEQFRLGLSRIGFIVHKALEKSLTNYDSFLNYLNYVFDEIMFLNSITKPYPDIKKIFTEFIQQHHAADVLKPQVLLGGSGVYMLSTLITTAIGDIREEKGFHKGRIYLQGNVYFEIPIIISKLSGKTIPQQDVFLTFDKKSINLEKITFDELVDVVICGFQENVTGKPEFGSMDIDELISNQLQLRKECNSDERLIVIIDTTLSAFDEIQMSHLLTTYESEIQAGKIAIMTSHSLNKYFHMGFDVTPAGLGVAYYNPQYFPKLAALCEKDWLSDFHPDDPTPQMLAHLIKHTPTHIVNYNNLIKGNARYVHSELVAKDLMRYSTSPKYVSIDFPYTRDIHHEIWGFVVFSITTPDEKTTRRITNDFKKLCAQTNVSERMGYGYGHTAFTWFGTGNRMIMRISLGTESKVELQQKLLPLLNYATEINEIVSLYRDMPKIRDEELLKLSDNYIKQFENKQIVADSISAKADKKEDASTLYTLALEQERKSANNDVFRQQSINNFFAAAKLRYPDAEYKMGLIYESSGKEKIQAFKWFKIASRHNHVSALYKLASCYAHGIGVLQDEKKAFINYKKAADFGHIDALYQLGKCYEKATGVTKDLQAAIRLFTQIGEKGHADANFTLGDFYQHGIGVEIDLKKSEDFYRKAAKRHHAEAAYRLGDLYEAKQDVKTAFEYYQQAADLGHPISLYNLGLYYETGKAGNTDTVEAVKYFQLAADKGYANAQFKLATCYEHGNGVEKNLKKARTWFQKAAQNGHPKANSAINDLKFREDILHSVKTKKL